MMMCFSGKPFYVPQLGEGPENVLQVQSNSQHLSLMHVYTPYSSLWLTSQLVISVDAAL